MTAIEAINGFPNALRDIQVPPTGSAEKFIGILGANLVFFQGQDENGNRIFCSAYDIIRPLGLKLGDPEVTAVRATFSRLTQVAEICGLIGRFPLPRPASPLSIPAEIQDQLRENLNLLHLNKKRIPVEQASFVSLFAQDLASLGMKHLADKLDIGKPLVTLPS